jgi:hypothetical protein
MPSLPVIEVFLRMLTALGCGAVIGLNRDLHHKSAGFRTFGLVSLGAAVVTMLTMQIPGSTADGVSHVIQGAGQFAIAWVSLALAMVLLICGGAVERRLEKLLGGDRRTREHSASNSIVEHDAGEP